jgi:hypothetical protein
MVVMLGGTGMGLVWGWYLGLAGIGLRSRFSLLTAATPLLVGQIAVVSGWSAASLFLGSVVVAWLIHHIWWRALAQHAVTAP